MRNYWMAAGAVVGGLILIWLVAGGIYAQDTRTAQPTGEDGCYLIVNKVYNMPFTEGETRTTRGIYCKVK